ncbi:hypothetical protein NMY22_g4184 [Coprinellus aureogranulatus]|nr:hypothetical protein NMY22_g4184 [Coprinellus aureogranulatus]
MVCIAFLYSTITIFEGAASWHWTREPRMTSAYTRGISPFEPQSTHPTTTTSEEGHKVAAAGSKYDNTLSMTCGVLNSSEKEMGLEELKEMLGELLDDREKVLRNMSLATGSNCRTFSPEVSTTSQFSKDGKFTTSLGDFDFEFAVTMNDLLGLTRLPTDTRNISKRTASKPFMAMNVLLHPDENGRRTRRHDLESIIWSLVWLCRKDPDWDDVSHKRVFDSKTAYVTWAKPARMPEDTKKEYEVLWRPVVEVVKTWMAVWKEAELEDMADKITDDQVLGVIKQGGGFPCPKEDEDWDWARFLVSCLLVLEVEFESEIPCAIVEGERVDSDPRGVISGRVLEFRSLHFLEIYHHHLRRHRDSLASRALSMYGYMKGMITLELQPPHPTTSERQGEVTAARNGHARTLVSEALPSCEEGTLLEEVKEMLGDILNERGRVLRHGFESVRSNGVLQRFGDAVYPAHSSESSTVSWTIERGLYVSEALSYFDMPGLPSTTQNGFKRKAPKPFMALDLQAYPLNTLKRTHRHDLESVIWSLVWLCRQDPDWNNLPDKVVAGSKGAYFTWAKAWEMPEGMEKRYEVLWPSVVKVVCAWMETYIGAVTSRKRGSLSDEKVLAAVEEEFPCSKEYKDWDWTHFYAK